MSNPSRLLVLGGTRSLGRHLVDLALARGDDVTVFTRGTQPNHWPGRVRALTGNRDQAVSPGMRALEDGSWDAVVDTCGYVPRIVRQSAELLAPRVGCYLFVSSISVFADASRAGLNEEDPVGALEDPNTEEIARHYGPLKAACEHVVRDVYGDRALNVRPGLIVGPHDPTDRFNYWVARFVHPELLGDRAPEAVVPRPRSRPIQLVDARDLAAFLIELLDQGLEGTHNATSPSGQWTMGAMVDALCEVGGARAPKPRWLDEAILLARNVQPWTGLPLWIPLSSTDEAGFMQIDCTKAERAGLRTRPLAQTIRDTAEWLAARENATAWKDVLAADAEREALDAAR